MCCAEPHSTTLCFSCTDLKKAVINSIIIKQRSNKKTKAQKQSIQITCSCWHPSSRMQPDLLTAVSWAPYDRKQPISYGQKKDPNRSITGLGLEPQTKLQEQKWGAMVTATHLFGWQNKKKGSCCRVKYIPFHTSVKTRPFLFLLSLKKNLSFSPSIQVSFAHSFFSFFQPQSLKLLSTHNTHLLLWFSFSLSFFPQ